MTTEQRLLNDAANEIVKLRETNEKMRIRLTAIDDMLQLVNSSPARNNQGLASPNKDIVNEIDDHLRDNLDDLTQAVRDAVTKRRIR